MIQVALKTKPLSVNRVWQGRRFKTKDYLDYEKELLYELPYQKIITGDVKVSIDFYLKSIKRSDIDNFAKPLLDILVKKKYIEDDTKIMDLRLRKFIGEPETINFLSLKSIIFLSSSMYFFLTNMSRRNT